jgi:hypothetical protein
MCTLPFAQRSHTPETEAGADITTSAKYLSIQIGPSVTRVAKVERHDFGDLGDDVVSIKNPSWNNKDNIDARTGSWQNNSQPGE